MTSLSLNTLSWEELNQLKQKIDLEQNQRQAEFYSIWQTKDLAQLERFAQLYPHDISFISYDEKILVNFSLEDIPFIKRVHSLLQHHPALAKFQENLFLNTRDYSAPNPPPDGYGLFNKAVKNLDDFVLVEKHFSDLFLTFAHQRMSSERFPMTLELILGLEKYYSTEEYEALIKRGLVSCYDQAMFLHFQQQPEKHHLFTTNAKYRYLLNFVLKSSSYIPMNYYQHDAFFSDLFKDLQSISNLANHCTVKNKIEHYHFFLDNFDLPIKNQSIENLNKIVYDLPPDFFQALLPHYKNHYSTLHNHSSVYYFLHLFYARYDFPNYDLPEKLSIYLNFIQHDPTLFAQFKLDLKNGDFYKSNFKQACEKFLLTDKLTHALEDKALTPKIKL